eukprot:m.42593 g.42593  ORF g.42593 m.42593 type:complete len:151 (+) comp10709_c0_seq2:1000-1452(+)
MLAIAVGVWLLVLQGSIVHRFWCHSRFVVAFLSLSFRPFWFLGLALAGYSRRASNASILHPAAGGAVPTRDSMVSLSPTPSSPSAQLHSSAVALEPQSQQVSFATSPVASLPITATEQAQRLDEEPASALASTSVVLQIQDSGAEPESRA